jgi:hypothetical protein
VREKEKNRRKKNKKKWWYQQKRIGKILSSPKPESIFIIKAKRDTKWKNGSGSFKCTSKMEI